MKRILCYGDSNTWGYVPGTGQRFEEDVRWTGRMQMLLGPSYRVIEAGLSGRTTTVDDPYDDTLNGLKGLPMTLHSAAPLDMVILMLGPNDLKFQNAWKAAKGIQTLITEIRRSYDCFPNGAPEILLVGPAPVAPQHTILLAEPDDHFIYHEVKKMGAYYREFARLLEVHFFDAADIVQPSDADGIHLDAHNHGILAEALTAEVRKILPDVDAAE